MHQHAACWLWLERMSEHLCLGLELPQLCHAVAPSAPSTDFALDGVGMPEFAACTGCASRLVQAVSCAVPICLIVVLLFLHLPLWKQHFLPFFDTPPANAYNAL